MDEKPQTSVEDIGHLGLVAAIVKKFEIVKQMDALIPKESNNQKISHADAILGMVYQGLGFTDGRLYFAEDHFKNKPLEALFGKDVKPEMFNDDVLGGALDAVYSYGPTKFVANLAFKTVLANDLMSKFAHIDTTTHPFHGREYKKQKESAIKVNFGHSKSRPDLPQLVQLLVSTESGIPFWTSTHSGNSSDSTLFPSSIAAIQEFVKSLGSEVSIGFVADASLYKKKFLLSQGNSCAWISRVPESIKLAKGLVEKDHASTNWIKIDKDFKYDVHLNTYGKVQQRWFVVNNREARHKELKAFDTNLKKEEELLTAKVLAMHNKIYTKRSDIFSEVSKIKKLFSNFEIERVSVSHLTKGKDGRAKATDKLRVHIVFDKNEEKIQKIKNSKGKFIVATNVLDDTKLPENEVIEIYRGRPSKIERCFKILKDRSLKLNHIFLKRLDRIEALLAVMTVCLFIHNLGQLEIKQKLAENQETIPNQIGKQIANPTMKWIYQLMKSVMKITVQFSGKMHQTFQGIGETQKKIIKCFGQYAEAIYGFEHAP